MAKVTDTYVAKIHTWGAQNWWHALIVNGAGVLVGLLLMIFGAKYLPASVVNDITEAVANTHVYAVGVSDSVVVSGTVVQP